MRRCELVFLVFATTMASALGSPFGAPKVAEAFQEPTNPKSVVASTDATRSHLQPNSPSVNKPVSYHTIDPQQYSTIQEAVAALNEKANKKYRELTGDTISDAKVVGSKGQDKNELSGYIIQDEDKHGNPVFTITDLEELPSSGGKMEKQLTMQPKQYYIYHTGKHTKDSLTIPSAMDYKNLSKDPNLVAVLAYDAAANTTAGMGKDGYLFNITRDGKLIDMSMSQSSFCSQNEREIQTAKFLMDGSGNGGGAACVPHSVDTSKFDAFADRQISYMKALIVAGKPMAANQISTYNSYLKAMTDEIPAMAQKIMDLHVSEDEQKRIFFNACESKLDTIVSLFNTMIANGIAGDLSRTAEDEICSKLGDVVLESGRAGDDIVTTSIKACKFMEEASKRQGKQQ